MPARHGLRAFLCYGILFLPHASAVPFTAELSPRHHSHIVRGDALTEPLVEREGEDVENQLHATNGNGVMRGEDCFYDAPEKLQPVYQTAEFIEGVGKWKIFGEFWRNLDKFQLTAAMTSIFGEATLGMVALKDESATTDGLLALPTVIVSLLGGVKAVGEFLHKGPRWAENQQGVLNVGTQVSIWSVCFMLMFQAILNTGFDGVEIPQNYRSALLTHSGFLAINLIQGAWEVISSGSLSAGTGRLRDTVKLNAWRASAKTKTMLKGAFNFATRFLRREAAQATQQPAVSLDHFVPVTRELMRMAMEAHKVSTCIEDTNDFHARNAALAGGQATPETCKTAWEARFGHIFQNDPASPSRVEDEAKDVANVMRAESLAMLADVEDDGSMMQTIILDTAGNVIPAIVFAIMTIVTQGDNTKYNKEVGWTIFAMTTVLQAIFFQRASKALKTFFLGEAVENPKLPELRAAVSKEMESGTLVAYKQRGVSIHMMVLSRPGDGYSAHQARFSIVGCEPEYRPALEKELLKIAMTVKVYPARVFLDTQAQYFGRPFVYADEHTIIQGPSPISKRDSPAAPGLVLPQSPAPGPYAVKPPATAGGVYGVTWESLGLFFSPKTNVGELMLGLVNTDLPCREKPDMHNNAQVWYDAMDSFIEDDGPAAPAAPVTAQPPLAPAVAPPAFQRPAAPTRRSPEGTIVDPTRMSRFRRGGPKTFDV